MYSRLTFGNIDAIQFIFRVHLGKILQYYNDKLNGVSPSS
jgi:hypothetical protein